MTQLRSIIRGVGHYLPERVVENSWFEAQLDTTDQWIRERTGIERRHFAAADEATSSMAIRAGQAALDNAGMDIADIDVVLVATSTPDNTFPSVATMVQAGLGSRHGFAYDIQAVCAGFVFALANADAVIRSGQARRVLVIGAETFSRILDFEDRGTCVLFGDGAGAVILEGNEQPGGVEDRGILAVDLHSDGRFHDILYVDGGVSTTGKAGLVRMQGNLVFRHAVEKLAETARIAIARAGLSPEDVDWLVPHQANLRIINATAQRMGLPADRVVLTVADHGNTSAASIPLALSVAVANGSFKQGDVLVLEAIGGGLVWGSVVLRW